MMQQTVLKGVVGLAVLMGAVPMVYADELDELRQQLEQQYTEMAKMQARLIELETAQKEQAATVAKLESSPTMEVPETLSWLENLKLFGDFRYRYESNSWDSDDGSSNERHRNFIRLRIGLKTKINEEFDFAMRVITGSDNPTGANQTLGEDPAFGSRDIWLDQAYLTYKPASLAGVKVLAGKMPTPFYRPGSSQLIWDSDLSPEGAAIQYTPKFSETLSGFANFGYMIVETENKTGDDGMELFGIQGGLTHTLTGGSLTYGAGFFDYDNTKGHAALANGFKGNSNESDVYLYNYSMAEVFGDYQTRLGELPIRLYGDYVVNTASDVEADTGWLAGTTLGKAKAVGSCQFGYEYRDLDADCVVGTYSDSDFIGGGTGGKGHKFNFKYQLAQNTQIATTYCCAERTAGDDGKKDDDYSKFQLDFIVKF